MFLYLIVIPWVLHVIPSDIVIDPFMFMQVHNLSSLTIDLLKFEICIHLNLHFQEEFFMLIYQIVYTKRILLVLTSSKNQCLLAVNARGNTLYKLISI